MYAVALPLALLTSACLAAPAGVAKRAASYTTAEGFTLVAKVTKPAPGLNVDNFVVIGAHYGAGEDFAALYQYNATANDTGNVFWSNGTTDEFIYKNSYISSQGGTPLIPYGWVQYDNGTDADGVESQAISEINAGYGTPGVAFAGVSYTGPGFPDDNPYLSYSNTTVRSYGSQFYACNATIYGNIPIIAVRWRSGSGVTPDGCAEIKLLPQCAGKFDDGLDRPYLQQSPCFEDATCQDVSTWSS